MANAERLIYHSNYQKYDTQIASCTTMLSLHVRYDNCQRLLQFCQIFCNQATQVHCTMVAQWLGHWICREVTSSTPGRSATK